jgi:hypothetical protein
VRGEPPGHDPHLVDLARRDVRTDPARSARSARSAQAGEGGDGAALEFVVIRHSGPVGDASGDEPEGIEAAIGGMRRQDQPWLSVRGLEHSAEPAEHDLETA